MNTPISFELAKLLKEKGFNAPCIQQYYNHGELLFCVDVHGRPMLKTNDKSYLDSGGYCISAPTIAEVVMWLRENHGVWISVRIGYGYEFALQSTNQPISLVNDGYSTPTQAYESAIEHCLKRI